MYRFAALLPFAAFLAFSPAVTAAHKVPVDAALSSTTHFVNLQVSHDKFIAHSEPAIAENPHNPLNLVAGSKFFRTRVDATSYQFKIGTYYSLDGGKSWHDSGLLPGFKSFFRNSDISFAFSPNGSIVYACVLGQTDANALGQQGSGIYVSRSKNGGKSWSNPITVFLDSTGATFSDKPWITVDGSNGPYRGRVYVAWNLDSNSASFRWRDPDSGDTHLSPALRRQQGHASSLPDPGLMVASSSDYGRSFSAPVSVSGFDNYHFALGGIPQVGSDGTLSVAFLDYFATSTDTVEGMGIVQSTDGGATFSPPRSVVKAIEPLPNHLPNSNFRNVSLPSFAVSQHDNSMILTWADYHYGDADVMAVRSTDGGLTWAQPVRVNDDPMRDGKDQFQPEVAVAPNGVYTIAWFDRRLDPQNRLIDEFIAQTTNDGKSFHRNLRVTTKSWNPAIDAPYAEADPRNTFIGDYQALAVDNTTVHPLWNDTQNGKTQQIRTAAIAQQVLSRY